MAEGREQVTDPRERIEWWLSEEPYPHEVCDRMDIAFYAIRNVLALHRPVDALRRGHPTGHLVCLECRRSWPCPTIRALLGGLGLESKEG